ncbi:hypothetical protein [Rhodoferax ferrireducens]|uniref:hypothetical protein n=1 Tax=Rhodoferax ferrireducens TaxID=192843 RepID=UPI001300B26F|nr:hypothetical protein [Rhodoferax ferrireducens]
MMSATGTLTLAERELLATVASDGTFVLALLAFDHRDELLPPVPWRITWCGLNAKLFWHINQHAMKAGRVIDIEATRLWPFGNAQLGKHEMHATATRITLRPDLEEIRAQRPSVVREQLSETEPAKPAWPFLTA